MSNIPLIFAGSGSQRLAAAICERLGVRVGRGEVTRFSEGNLFVRLTESVRGRRVYIVQAIAFPANDNLIELLFWIDACKRSSAESVTTVIPYFSYAKGDKQDEPRVSIRARVCADAIEGAGADHVVTLDLHNLQVQGFFKVPVADLRAMPVLCDDIRAHIGDADASVGNLVVVSPDVGFAKKARQFAARILAAVTHGVFARGSMEKLDASPIEQLLITDSIETQPVTFSQKVRIVSIAPLLAEAIRRIQRHESLSELFPQKV